MLLSCLTRQVQAELHKDPHVKPEQVSISRSGGCLSLSTRPSTHDAPYPVHGGPGTVSPVAAPPIPAGGKEYSYFSRVLSLR